MKFFVLGADDDHASRSGAIRVRTLPPRNADDEAPDLALSLDVRRPASLLHIGRESQTSRAGDAHPRSEQP